MALTEHTARLGCQPYYAAYVIDTGAESMDAAWERDGNNVPYIAWINERWRELRAVLGVGPDEPVHEDRMLEYLEERIGAILLKQAAALLDDAWNPETMEYDTQGVSQAHRVLRGGDPPRATRQHDVDEGAP